MSASLSFASPLGCSSVCSLKNKKRKSPVTDSIPFEFSEGKNEAFVHKWTPPLAPTRNPSPTPSAASHQCSWSLRAAGTSLDPASELRAPRAAACCSAEWGPRKRAFAAASSRVYGPELPQAIDQPYKTKATALMRDFIMGFKKRPPSSSKKK